MKTNSLFTCCAIAGKLFCLSVFILPVFSASAQNIQNLYFNSYNNIVKMNFTTGVPVISYTGISNGYEGIAHQEDGLGNVIFYVNSNGVYRANGVLMPGSVGLIADPSSTEIDICPFPDNPNKYYIFYNNQTCSPLYYSIVDMTLAGGQGDVTNLNTVLSSGNFSEGFEIVRRDCGSYWLLAYQCNVKFVKFLIDSNGIGALQTVYNYAQPAAGYDGRGQLDYFNGKMGLAFAFIPYAFVADFDPITGTLSNPVTLNFPTASAFTGMYGLTFSPDGTKAYITNWYNDQTNNIFQYNFLTGTMQSWKSSNQPGMQGGEVGPGQIQLGTDSNLYIVNNGVHEITVISNPSSLAPTISHIQTTSILALGISDIIKSDLFHHNSFTYINYCTNDSIQFSGTVYSCSNSTSGVSVLWNFGDPSSGVNDTSTLISPAHSYALPGNYTVTMIVMDSNYTDTVIQNINIFTIAPFNLGPDTNICNGTPLNIGATIVGATYIWSGGSTTSHINVSSPGTYYLTAFLGPCSRTDSIHVDFIPGPSVNLGSDTTLCFGLSYVIDAGNPGFSYQWNNGNTTQVITVDTTGTYIVSVSNAQCTDIDTIQVNFFNPPPLFLGADDTICQGSTVTIGASVTNASYQWSNGATTAQIAIGSAGTYTQTITLDGCTATDDINITVAPSPSVNLGNDTILCNIPSYTLNAGNPGSVYTWNDGTTNQSLNVVISGVYTVTVSNGQCSDVDSVLVTLLNVNSVSLGPDTTACSGSTITLSTGLANVSYLWSTGDTNSQINVTTPGTYWLIVSSGSCSQSDTINVNFVAQPVVNLGNDTVLCYGDTRILDAGNPGTTYLWSNGSTTQQITVSTGGVYTVSVSAGGGCADVDTVVVIIESSPDVNLGPDQYICGGIPAILKAPSLPGYTYLWSTGEHDSIITVTESGTYFVEMDDGVCRGSDTVSVIKIEGEVLGEVPNVFTPNGDGKNDFFKIPASEHVTEFYIDVYDRWGRKMFESEDVNNSWDGKFNDNMVPEGVYFYMLTYESPCNGARFMRKGFVHVLYTKK